MDFVNIFGEFVELHISYSLLQLYAVILIAIALYLIFFIFKGVGLYTMASKQGLNKKWQAFVPFANIYLMGRLTGPCPFCGKTIKKIQKWLLLFEILAFVTGMFYYVSSLILMGDLFAQYRTPYSQPFIGSFEITQYEFSNLTGWRSTFFYANQVGYYIYEVLQLIYFIVLIIALVNLFRKYSARNYMMITMWSLILFLFFRVPAYAVFIFAMRNNRAVDYKEYINKRRAEYYRQQSNFYNNYNNTNPYDYYNRNNSSNNSANSGYNFDPYTGKPIHHNTNGNDAEPFSDLSSSTEDRSANHGDNGNNGDSNHDDPFSF